MRALKFQAPPDYENHADADRDGTYEVTVTAGTGGTDTGSLAVRVTVTNVNEPHQVGGDTSVDVSEGGALRVGAYTVTDPENAMFTWRLTGADRSDFTISSDGVLSFAVVPDFEARADANRDNTFEVTVEASDGSISEDIDVAVRVTNEEESGSLTLPTQPQVDTRITAVLTDPDGSISGRTWAWHRATAAAGPWTSISGATSGSYTPTATDENHHLQTTVTYTDGYGTGNSARTVADNPVQPKPATNQPPRFPSSTATRSVDENTLSGTGIGLPVEAGDTDPLTYTLEGAHATSFEIERSTCQILTKNPLDYESRRRYQVRVRATDPSGATDTIAVTIEVVNLNEPGAVNLSMDPPRAGTLLRADLDDPDGSISGRTWAWHRATAAAGPWTSISGATSGSYTPTAADENHHLQTTVTYTDGYGTGNMAQTVTQSRVEPEPQLRLSATPLRIAEGRTSTLTASTLGGHTFPQTKP